MSTNSSFIYLVLDTLFCYVLCSADWPHHNLTLRASQKSQRHHNFQGKSKPTAVLEDTENEEVYKRECEQFISNPLSCR